MLNRFAVVFAVILMLFGAGGCNSTAPNPAMPQEAAARYITPGGTYYRISNPQKVFTLCEQLIKELRSVFSEPDVTPPEFKAELLRFCAVVELLWKVAGVDENTMLAASSVPLVGNPELFENRVFLALPPERKGLLWNLTGSNNRPLKEEIRAMPSDTILAADLMIDATALGRALKPHQKLFSRAKLLSSAVLGVPLESLLAGISGEWGFLLTAGEKVDYKTLDGLQLMITLPDADGVLFRNLTRLSQIIAGTEIKGNRVVLGPLKQGLIKQRPELHLKDGRIYIYSDHAMIEHLADENAPRLADKPDFQALFAGLPENGSGLWYAGCWFIQENFISKIKDGFINDLRASDYRELTVLSNEPGGKLLVSHSDWDLNQVEFFNQVLVPVSMLSTLALSPWLEERREMYLDQQERQDCSQKLKALAKMFKQYASKNGGRFPADDGIAGLKKLLKAQSASPKVLICPGSEDEAADNIDSISIENYSYLYFGGYTEKSNPKLPLLVDWPFNHLDAVNVLLVDGTVETLELENPSNCRRVISCLHTRFHYTETEFKLLMSKATAFDQEYEMD